MEITKDLASRVLKAVDSGLIRVFGNPIHVPGYMSVENALCTALGEGHSGRPDCVSPILHLFSVRLNDALWSSKWTRAAGLRRLAISILGTSVSFDETIFLQKLAELTDAKLLPIVAELPPKSDNSKLLKAAERCRSQRSASAANYVSAVASFAGAADKWVAERAETAARFSTADQWTAAMKVGDQTGAPTNAGAASSDRLLSEFAEGVVQILVEMRTPGSEFLFLTNRERR